MNECQYEWVFRCFAINFNSVYKIFRFFYNNEYNEFELDIIINKISLKWLLKIILILQQYNNQINTSIMRKRDNEACL